MATVVDFDTCKKAVVSILQASLTNYGSSTTGNAPDGSTAQFASSTEINNAILETDGEVCTLIAKTPGHPFQTAFVIGSPSSLTNGSNLPSRNGMILRVTGQLSAAATQVFASTDVNTTTDLVTITNHGLVTGQPVQLTTNGSLPTGLSLATTYYIIRSTSSTFGFASSVYNAKASTLIDLSATGTATTNTITTQFQQIYPADSKATIDQMVSQPYIFADDAGNVAGWYFAEGDEFYTTCPAANVYYTDYILTTSPQAPEPYIWALIAGAVSKLAKDGFDAQMCAYYQQMYQQYLADIAQSAKMVPDIVAYKGQ